MATLHSPTTRIPQNPPQHTFMDQKQPLLPRQSTSDVLSFTHIIANRLAPGQSVWEFFSPPPPPAASSDNCPANGLPPLSPTMAMERTNSSSSSRLGLSNPCPGFQSSMASMPSPTSPEFPSIAQRFSSDAGSRFTSDSGSRRQSLTVRVDRQVPMTLTENCSNEQKQKLVRCKIDGDNNDAEGDSSSSPSSFTPSSPTPSPLSLLPLPSGLMTGDVVDDAAASAAAIHPPRTTAAGELPIAPLVPLTTTATSTTTSQNSAMVATSTSPTVTAAEASTTATAVVERETPKLQKRRSFAQSLKNSVLSLTQLLSPVSSISSSASSTRVSSPSIEAMNMSTRTATAAAAAMTTVNRHGGPHYNILVLGSDSAPLASTLYKMSSLLPGTSKIRHYQEISGFFVAHFRSDEPSPPPSSSSSSTSPLPSTGLKEYINQSSSMESGAASARSSEETLSVSSELRTSSTHSTITEATHSSSCSGDKLVEDACFISEKVVRGLTVSADDPGPTNTGNEDAETVVQDDESGACQQDLNQDPSLHDTSSSASPSSSPGGGSLSLHAFSLDTMWPVPRTLAQTFWFPYAHGIIFIVDATRKHDPRAVDHLLNARQFLTSLVSDPHFCRQDIPVTVFANKAGSDPETCYRLDEIAEILGCEEWDVCSASAAGGTSPKRARPWCVKSTKADGEGDGIRESVEWLKSRMGEVWSTPE